MTHTCQPHGSQAFVPRLSRVRRPQLLSPLQCKEMWATGRYRDPDVALPGHEEKKVRLHATTALFYETLGNTTLNKWQVQCYGQEHVDRHDGRRGQSYRSLNQRGSNWRFP